MAETSRKLKRLIDDEEKAMSKIAEWQEILETTRASRKKEEDSEIIRSIRSLKLEPRELYELLVGIQKGTVSMETRQKILDAIEEETAGEGGARRMCRKWRKTMMQCKTSAGKRCFMAVLAAATACVLMMSCAAPAYANTEKGWNTGGTYVQEEAGVDGSGTGDENSGSTEESSGLSENGSGTGSGTEENSGALENGSRTGSGTEENARGEQGFTTPGNGTLGDQVKNSGSKDFFTVRTKNNNTFYLVIDHANSSENVYMLSLIDEDDLAEFLKEGQDSKKQASPAPVVIPETKPQTQTQAQDPAPAQEKPAGILQQYGIWLFLAAISLIVILIYYFSVYKPRHEEEEEETDEGLETAGDGLATESDE